MSFASRLKLMMVERQMTQIQLANAIGKGKSSVSQYISGKNIPKEDVQKQIADALNVSVEFLTGGEQPGISDSRNISVKECAKLLGKSEQFVRVALQSGSAPFGFAVRNKTVYSYHISAKKLAEYIGGDVI